MPDFSALTHEKFICYFCENTVFCIDDNEMNDFFDLMKYISESVQFPAAPTEIARDIFERASLSGTFYENLISVVHGNYIATLNALEIFTLLWFSSCRNVITYTDANYLRSAENGTIGRLLNRLKEV